MFAFFKPEALIFAPNTVSISTRLQETVITSEYEALFRQHFRLATLYAERIVGSAHEAEDIVQEVFIALLDVDFSQIRQKESYLYRCVRNAALATTCTLG